MKILILPTILFFAFLALGGCGGSAATSTGNTAKPATNSTGAANKPPAATAPAAATPATVSNLKPADINPDKPVPAEELSAAVMANEAAWKDKTVSVVGSYHSTTTSKLQSGDQIRVDIADDKGKKRVACTVKTDVPQEVIKGERKGRVFKGTVKEMFFDQILLEPCEFVK